MMGIADREKPVCGLSQIAPLRYVLLDAAENAIQTG
jgi:hypothetical protein